MIFFRYIAVLLCFTLPNVMGDRVTIGNHDVMMRFRCGGNLVVIQCGSTLSLQPDPRPPLSPNSPEQFTQLVGSKQY